MGSTNVGLQDHWEKVYDLSGMGAHKGEVGNIWLEVLENKTALDKPKFHHEVEVNRHQ